MARLLTAESLTAEERQWLREQLHAEEMHCRQCMLVQRLLDTTEEGS